MELRREPKCRFHVQELMRGWEREESATHHKKQNGCKYFREDQKCVYKQIKILSQCHFKVRYKRDRKITKLMTWQNIAFLQGSGGDLKLSYSKWQVMKELESDGSTPASPMGNKPPECTVVQCLALLQGSGTGCAWRCQQLSPEFAALLCSRVSPFSHLWILCSQWSLVFALSWK